MESEFLIGNRKLLPLKKAAEKVSYSRDYVARLAREGKIAALQVNRQWYIDPESLQNFFEVAQFELRARADYTSELRRGELEAIELWQHDQLALERRRRLVPQRVVVQTVFMLTLSVCAGFLVYSSVALATPQQLEALLGQLLHTETAPAPVVGPPGYSWGVVGNVLIQDEVINLDNGIVLLPGMGATTTTVEEFFSDPVSVQSQGQRGVIISEQSGVTTTMPFVRVPGSSTVIGE